jgi:hypothetical protein
MDYRVEPTRLARRTGRTLFGASAAAVVVFGLVVILIADPSSRDPRARPSPTPQPEITCHGLGPTVCQRVAFAAIAAIDDATLPPVRAIGVWATLLCGDVFDCPPGRLNSGRVAGSAVLELADARTLWVNVAEAEAGGLEAWVIRAG